MSQIEKLEKQTEELNQIAKQMEQLAHEISENNSNPDWKANMERRSQLGALNRKFKAKKRAVTKALSTLKP